MRFFTFPRPFSARGELLFTSTTIALPAAEITLAVLGFSRTALSGRFVATVFPVLTGTTFVVFSEPIFAVGILSPFARAAI
ncbi:hypothetical protein [Saccharopolyspora rectivirgula]|uniref:hypothetical protein n=1 Tax=Saccharopolyspora rectivirgula TaxID=28042 RepID=UPI0024090E66|nr:hypothetical protein [Saccharopolyspora rectivirgula]